MPYTFKQIAGMSVDQISDLASRGDKYREFCAAVKKAAKAAATPKSNHPEIPDGWVLVPREPTEAMLDEADWKRALPQQYIRDVWATMLTVSPKPSVDESGKGSE